MVKIYHEQDANPGHLQGCRVAVLGYGKMGRPLALNMRDSAVNVIVGNVEDASAAQARQDGFQVYSMLVAVKHSNIILMTLPDAPMPQLFLEHVLPELKPGDLLLFTSGYNLTFKFIEPPPFVDSGMIAPRAMGERVREGYEKGTGYPAFIAMHHKASVDGLNRLLAVARGMGALKQGALELPIPQEVELDLFWQQALLPVFHAVLLTAVQFLIQEGYPGEAVLTELYLSGESSDFFTGASLEGIAQTLEKMSLMAQYGVLSRTVRFREARLKTLLGNVLDEIRTGQFAQELTDEHTNNYPRLESLQKQYLTTSLWNLEKSFLADMTSADSDSDKEQK